VADNLGFGRKVNIRGCPWVSLLTRCTAGRCSALQCSVVQCSAVQCSAVQAGRGLSQHHSAAQWARLRGGRGGPTELHCTALHCTLLHCTLLHCTALSMLMFPGLLLLHPPVQLQSLPRRPAHSRLRLYRSDAIINCELINPFTIKIPPFVQKFWDKSDGHSTTPPPPPHHPTTTR
jgi:hypothetical protein